MAAKDHGKSSIVVRPPLLADCPLSCFLNKSVVFSEKIKPALNLKHLRAVLYLP